MLRIRRPGNGSKIDRIDDKERLAASTKQTKNGGGLAISLVIPTKNEAENIRPLVTAIERATADIPTEIIFVDDSNDATPAVISELAQRGWAVSVIHRPPDRRSGGLGGAVVEGIRAAQGEWVCVMDADLQHPPELIPDLYEASQSVETDIVVASRYAPNGDNGGLSAARGAVSRLCTWGAHLMFPRRLRSLSDPLSGFFLVRREAIDPDALRPHGFKILLEIVVRFPNLLIAEVPFQFQTRKNGQSKGTMKEGLRYVVLLLDLRFGGAFRRVSRFGLVGASGLVVNQGLFWGLAGLAGMHYLPAAALATLGSTLWNFSLLEAWVFRDRVGGQTPRQRLIHYLLLNGSTVLLRAPLLLILTSGLGVHYLLSNLVTLLTFSAGRYMLSDWWIWADAATRGRRTSFSYDIHGIIRIISEVRLLELEYFRTGNSIKQPDIRIRIGRSSSRAEEPSEVVAVNNHKSDFRYREILGPLGFWVEMTRGKSVEVAASPLLRMSPHVLYTNVVEPILRWTLVQKGYALVHAACVSVDGKAVLITAKTDTGKTTTILRTLKRHQFTFLSDDMIILSPKGRVLSFPKPLTVSNHTVAAVDGAQLSRWERLTLPIQSRVHSKSGRRTALTLARTPLPMASINAVIQAIVPPPKYTIDRLIPNVEIGREATVSHLMVIEAGEDLQASLDPEMAEKLLLKNCEDAYGFPPYPVLEPYLSVWKGLQLRGIEREIIGKGLRGCSASYVRSETRDWWERLPVLLAGDSSRPAKARNRGASSLEHLRVSQ